MSACTRVDVLGATGLVGRRLVSMLVRHPWFEPGELYGSERRAGMRWGDAVSDGVGLGPDAVPDGVLDRVVRHPRETVRSPVVLSALPSAAARGLEVALAWEGRVVSSNASFHRTDPLVPLLVPEVNADVLDGLAHQPWSAAGGALVTNPNCVVAGIVPVLAAVDRAWGVESGAVVTLQALSGAGLSGPGALSMAGNVVPLIVGEEEKIGAEVARILGRPVTLAVTVNRVPVVDGHLAHLFLRLGRPAPAAAVEEALASFEGPEHVRGLPSLPPRPLRLVRGLDRPQPRLDVEAAGGMVVSVGRVRPVPGYDVAMTVLVHNLVRGAAGACLANAELVLATRTAVPPVSVAV